MIPLATITALTIGFVLALIGMRSAEVRRRYLEHYTFGVNACLAGLPRRDVEDFGRAALDGFETVDRKLTGAAMRSYKRGVEDAGRAMGRGVADEAEEWLRGT